MTNLRKYYYNDIKPEGLPQLRDEERQKTDEQLVADLEPLWEEELSKEHSAQTDSLQTISAKLMESIEPNPTSKETSNTIFRRISWITSIVASVMLLLLIGMGYRYHSYKQNLSAQRITVSTRTGELAQVVLPDGTQIKLAGNSKLIYSPTFNGKNRSISFEGEAYFQVAHDSAHPFLVEMNNLKVKVKGTKFNLRNRQKESLSSLSLQEGCVELTSALSGKSVTLSKNQRAIIDTKTGEITISGVKDINEDIAWTNHQISFDNKPFQLVLKDIAQNYGLKLHLGKDLPNDPFTGTLPNNHIEEVIHTLEIIFKVNIQAKDGQLIVTK